MGRVFTDLDETIRQLLIQRIPIDPAEIDVSFEAPDREWSGRLSRPTVNCFLYDVRENHEFRETDWKVERKNGSATRTKAPVRIDATYQVSAWARAPEDEHRLLWRVLAVLMRHAELPEDLLQGGLKDQDLPVPARVAQPEKAPKNPADLWQALDNRIRPSLTYVVTLALDPDVVFTAPLVLTRELRVREGDDASHAFEIGGRVRQRDDPHGGLAGALVQLRETGAEAHTDAEGRFIFARVPHGAITLVVRAAGRPEVTHLIQVPSPTYDIIL